ncbi:hypothetical protein WR25_09839 [Diploscapter pachys]|uniref:Peroxisomal membrane protein PEX13 n=1 Tax=Diploscapter pachys TaxID=2018661 RepID=A0A2A2KU82_9BILA|nr:hypothetical protein WR25_09839 [Diploscapter pachys]
MSIPTSLGQPSSSAAVDINSVPPLPPRPYQEQNAHGMSHLNNPYGGFGGYSNYGMPMSYGMGMYGTGGLYGNSYGYGGMNPYGYGTGPESQFARLAEEQSRGAFQSIESVVMAVSSVANMLSSTHNAVYSSFRAVIGVVEQFARLKGQLTSVVVSLSIVRLLIRLWRRLLVFLRLKPANYASEIELAWGESKQPYGSEILGPSASSSAVNWPSLLFWGLYSFQAGNEQELSFMNGEILRVAPKEEQPKVRGWLLASTKEGDRIGLVPINYVKIVGRKTDSPPAQPTDSISKFESAFRTGSGTPSRWK